MVGDRDLSCLTGCLLTNKWLTVNNGERLTIVSDLLMGLGLNIAIPDKMAIQTTETDQFSGYLKN